ncbi:MAG: glycosyltransferase [Candidatus Pacebacteria bacterium]|nr:glycosyltransferase [Candidatus Paceibacterota bacterium]MDD5357432.1 glycosyltransferase [Candidatus Paceibacterota bacterium]
MDTISRKSKILFVITKSNWGGAQRYVYDLATNLPQQEFEPLVVFGGRGILASSLEKTGIKTLSLSKLERDPKLINDTKVFFELLRLFKKERPEIIHLNSSKIGAVGALAGRIAGIKNIIFTAHGFAFNEERSGISRFAIKCVTWLTLLLCTKVITLSDREEKQAKAFPGIKDKVTKIPNGIQLPHFLPKAESRERLAVHQGLAPDFFAKQHIIGMIAELTPNKGLLYTIEALEKIEEYVLLIIGDGEDREKLTKYIQEKNLGSKVFLLGFIQNAATFAKAFDIFLLSSLKEGLPYVLLEVGGAGVPVLTTAVGGIPTIIDDQKNGMLIKPKSAREIELGLKFLIAHKEERKMFGEKLRQDVAEKFNLEQMLQKTFEIYGKKDRKESSS